MVRKRKKYETAQKRPFTSVVMAAGGTSTRMGGLDKLMAPLGDAPLIMYALMACESCPDIDEIVIAAASESIIPIGQLCRDYGLQKVSKIIVGGATRVHSVMNGLMEISDHAMLVAVHDAARPLCTPDIISKAVRLAADVHAVVVAVEVKDTVKQTENGRVAATLPRDTLCAVQTPQVFDAALLKAALRNAVDNEWMITDDATAVERLGHPVYLSPGSYENIKVTTPEDLILAQALLEVRQ